MKIQSLWDADKARLIWKSTLNLYIWKEEQSGTNNLSSHFKKLEKEENKTKGNRRKEIMKGRNQWNWKYKTKQKSMKLKSGSFKRSKELINLKPDW